ncbi:5-formyltetrahydrofolate cyclo-ligase [Fictibacillus nanhaiensis]|uniref:5-formyltetrahydrofolate cyclo-ligase n=1 Tax=Fictibacillus nanhaiensis TaxID=742169 RepID=UPI002E1D0C36|nr:5-formyltetrahydrofolate cyclo-ligase [Fictibacillus nanhaiensis]MED1863469.1 5-formyltetrahydrofolate cyclo-ligase [Fictibacillus nanhaiensis]
MNKSQWRKALKQLLLSMGKEERKVKSEAISNLLFQTEEWKTADCFGITVSRGFELDTSYIINQAWREGKTVAVPKCYSEHKQMEFRKIHSYEELENVYMDLYEPKIDVTLCIEPSQMNMILVPGLVFDKEGFRIGYGGGYFDRYLHSYDGSKLSLAYTLQTTDSLPHENYDIPVDSIITEDGRFK